MTKGSPTLAPLSNMVYALMLRLGFLTFLVILGAGGILPRAFMPNPIANGFLSAFTLGLAFFALAMYLVLSFYVDSMNIQLMTTEIRHCQMSRPAYSNGTE